MYSSANAQMAFEQSRKDDLISIAFMLIEFATGHHLPWADCEKNNKIIEMKRNINLDEILKKCTLEDQIKQFCDLVNALKFEEKPNYNKLKNIFLH